MKKRVPIFDRFQQSNFIFRLSIENKKQIKQRKEYEVSRNVRQFELIRAVTYDECGSVKLSRKWTSEVTIRDVHSI